jgi:hypothetical protein
VTDLWTPKATTTHQDHVIAHVLGTTFLGYLVFEEALYVLLDIGFIWTIFLDGEMGLLPHPVAVSELEITAEAREQIKADIDLLLGSGPAPQKLFRLTPAPVECQIRDVSFFAGEDRRRLTIGGEPAGLVVETSLVTAEIRVMTFESEAPNDAGGTQPVGAGTDKELEDVAKTEHEYLHQRLRDELGREPAEEELDQWLREHTEGY